MHILFVTHYYEPSSGAAATRLTALAKRLHTFGHEITVLTTMPHYPKGVIDHEYQGFRTKRENRDGIECIYVWLWATSSSRVSRKLLSQWSFMVTGFLRGLTLPHPDVVFIEAQPMFTGLMGRIVARLKRAPYVLNVSDLWPDHLLTTGTLTESHPVYRMARWLVDTGYRGSAGIATMSDGWTEKVVQYLKGKSTEKVHTVLRGVDIDRFRPIEDVSDFFEKYDINPDKKWVTFLGTFSTPYDFDLMLDATEHFVGRDDVGFLIVGTGSQREKVIAGLESGRLPNVHYMEWLPHDEMPTAWNVSYMTYWALRDEPLYYGTIPARTYEVLATGTPIVAAQGGVAANMIRDSQGGIVVMPTDKDGFITAMTQVLDNPKQRDAMAVAGRAYAERELDFDVIAHLYERILMQAANQS